MAGFVITKITDGNQVHWPTPVIRALVGWKQEDQEFLITLNYTGSLRPSWARVDPVSKETKSKPEGIVARIDWRQASD